jgi:hypothetical protein
LKRALFFILVAAALASCSPQEVSLTPARDGFQGQTSAQQSGSFDEKNEPRRRRAAEASTSSDLGVARIAIGANGAVWVLASDNSGGADFTPYQYNPSTRTFTQVPGSASGIAVDPSGYAWVVNTSGNISKSNGAAPNATGFTSELSGYSASAIAVGANDALWVLGTTSLGGGTYAPYQRNPSTQALTPLLAAASAIAVDPSGDAWIVNGNGNIFKSDAAAPDAIAFIFEYLGDSASAIAFGANDALWVLGTTNLGGGNYTPSEYNSSTQTFTQVSGGASGIAVDPSGYAWTVNTNGNIYKSNAAAPNATGFNQVAFPAPTPPPSPPASTVCNQDPGIPSEPNSTFCQAIPPSPNVASNSSSIISYYTGSVMGQEYEAGGTGPGMIYQFGQTNPSAAVAHRSAIFDAVSTDPQYVIAESDTTAGNINGQTIYLPSGAQPESGTNGDTGSACAGSGGGEAHLVAVQPGGAVVYEFIGVSCIVPGNPGKIYVESGFEITLTDGNGWACGNPYEYPTGCQGGSVTASHRDLTQGLVSAKEILNGGIYHALAGTFPCSNDSYDAPAQGYDDPCSKQYSGGSNTNAIAEGQKLFLAACSTYPHCTASQSDATIAAWVSDGLTVPGEIVAEALAAYGVYYTDSYGGPTWDIEPIDPESYSGSHPITNYWPMLASTYSLAPYPNGGTANYGYDFGFRYIPTNPNGPRSAAGLWSWMAACSSSGC